MANNIVEISKSQEEYIIVNESQSLVVLPNTFVNILIKGSNLKINLDVARDSKVSILAVDSCDNEYKFIANGEIEFVEILLDNTKSSFNVELKEEYASIDVRCLAIAKNFTNNVNQRIVHKAKHTKSNINNYAVAFDSSKVLFVTEGKIEKGMSKSSCQQLTRGVIMDDESSVTAEPILLIDEYDVVANHGAAIGKMADDVLFYLMSRGLNKNEAFLLYLDGIINPFISKIKDDELKQSVLTKINNLIVR